MFWRSKKSKKRSKPQRRSVLAHWKLEHLEGRHMLSGVVNVVTTGAPGSLAFTGDTENDSIELQSDPTTPGQYIITGTGSTGTLLTLNGGAVATNTLTVNNITGDITVNLGAGNDTFDFEGPTGGGASTAPANVNITNNNGSDTNIFNNVVIDGNLNVGKYANSVGNASLSLTNTTVVGDAIVDNTAGGTGGGDSSTTISGSTLEGGGARSAALMLSNNNGNAILQVSGTTTFGAGFKGATVTVKNDNGGSVTTFAGTATLYGALSIINGDAPYQGQINMVTFNGTTVLGTTTIHDGHATAKVTATNSTLGSQLSAGAQPVTITNGLGYDTLNVTGGTIPWGLNVANDIYLPTAATAADGGTGGNLSAGTYYYKVAFVNAASETLGGEESTGLTIAANHKINLSNIPLGPAGTVARDIYRTTATGGPGSERFLATINDNTTTIYADNIADAALLGPGVIPAPALEDSEIPVELSLVVGNAGSNTSIVSSTIGTRIGGPNLGLHAVTFEGGDALQILGDNGPDAVSVASSTIGGTLDLSKLGSGNNSVSLDSNTIGSLYVQTASGTTGNNFLQIAGGTIQAVLDVDFGGTGSNTVALANGSTAINGSTAPVLPSLLNGAITINGGPGINTFHYAAGLTPPPLQNFTYIVSP